MRVLVTGGTGMLGANVVRALLDAGHTVRAVARDNTPRKVLDGLPIEIVPGELESLPSLVAAASGCEGLVHCAAHVWVGRTGDDVAWRVNVEGTRHVLDAAERGGVRRIVHVSTCDALSLRSDGGPAREEDRTDEPMVRCGYVLSKRAAEDLALHRASKGQEVVVVNPAYLLGPYDPRPTSGRMIVTVAAGGAWLAPQGGNSFVDVRIASRTIVTALERGTPGRRYIVGGENLSYVEAWTRIARLTGGRAPLGAIPQPITRIAGRLGGWWGRLRGYEPEINPITAHFGDLPHYFASDRAETELGHGRTDFDVAVTAAWEWLRANGHAR